MADYLPPDSSRPTPQEPLSMPLLKPFAVADVEHVTGLVLSIHESGWYVLARRATWPEDRFVAIDGPTWAWLGNAERRAAFFTYAVMLSTPEHPQVKALAGCTRWDP